jgi:hypothetical protein
MKGAVTNAFPDGVAGDLRRGLEDLGFHAAGGYLVRGALAAQVDGNWCNFTAGGKGTAARGEALFGAPGLWKPVSRPEAARPLREFHLPLAVFQDLEDREERLELLGRALRWVEASAAGAVPDGWSPPARELIEAWAPPQRLTVQAGPFVVQGKILIGDHRLAFRIPVLPSQPGAYSAARRQWLLEVLAAGQERWRLARLEWEPAGDALGVWCEVDLSGAPAEALECITRTGIDALRWLVGWLLVPVSFLGDPELHCELWEVHPERAWPAERKS